MIDPAVALDRSVRVLQDYVDAPAAEIVRTLGSLRVELRADDEALVEPTAQIALVSAFEAVARLGVEVVVDIPPNFQGAGLPPLRDGPLLEALRFRSSRLLRVLGTSGPCDLRFSFGATASVDQLGLGASDFQARLATGGTTPGWSGKLPFGAVMAGAIAGTEVARLAIRRLVEAGAPRVDRIPLDHRAIILALPSFDYPESGIDLGEIDFVSAGAITHSALFTLARVPKLRLRGRVFDDDRGAEDNLNRYVLLDVDGIDEPKELYLAGLPWPTFNLEGVHGRVGEGELASRQLAERVCVGVDSVEGRWRVQELAEGWIGVGATSHALAMVSEHWPGSPCAGCVHPKAAELAARLPTISFVSIFAGVLLAHALVRAVVAPVNETQVTSVLDAFKLAFEEPLVCERPLPNAACPVGCMASRSLAGA